MSELVGTTSLAPAGEGLHVPHQERNSAAPGTKYTTQIPITGFDWGQTTTLYLPPLPMNITDAWIQLDVAALATADGPYFVPTPWWASSINLLYRRQTLQSVSKYEAFLDEKYDTANQMQKMRRADLTNDVGATAATSRATGAWLYYIPLRRLVDTVLGKMGPTTAYAAQSWSLDINMMALNRLVRGTSSTAATGGAITTAKLILVGHKEDQDNINRVVAALDTKTGVQIKFEQGNYRRFEVAGSAASLTITVPELAGEVTSVNLFQHNKTAENETDPDALNPAAWQTFDGVADTLSIGTLSETTALFGQALPQRILRLIAQGDSWQGAATYNGFTGAQEYLGGVLAIPTEEAASLGMREGTFSGVLRISHDLLLTFTFGTTTVNNNYVEVLVMIRRSIAINQSGFGIVDATAA